MICKAETILLKSEIGSSKCTNVHTTTPIDNDFYGPNMAAPMASLVLNHHRSPGAILSHLQVIVDLKLIIRCREVSNAAMLRFENLATRHKGKRNRQNVPVRGGIYSFYRPVTLSRLHSDTEIPRLVLLNGLSSRFLDHLILPVIVPAVTNFCRPCQPWPEKDPSPWTLIIYVSKNWTTVTGQALPSVFPFAKS